MVSVIVGFASVLHATFIPLFIGLYLPVLAKRSSPRTYVFIAAVASGLIFWFFLDVMNDATLLDFSVAFGGGISHVLLAASFAFGLLLLFGLERYYSGKRSWSSNSGAASTQLNRETVGM